MLLAAAAALLAHAANNPAANNRGNLAIGVVEVQDVFHKMAETNKLLTDLRAKQQNQVAELERRKQDLQNLIEHRKDFKPGSAAWKEETGKIDRQSAELDVMARLSQVQLERDRNQATIALFDKIEKACQQVAEQQNLDLVLADRKVDVVGPDLAGIPNDNLTSLLGQRSVMYKNKRLDITADVLTLLDAQFAKQNGGK